MKAVSIVLLVLAYGGISGAASGVLFFFFERPNWLVTEYAEVGLAIVLVIAASVGMLWVHLGGGLIGHSR
jgi:hypothetical protein